MLKKERKRVNTKGQLTIFIIIAIVIVAALLVIFYPRIKTIFKPSTPALNLESCVESKLKDGIKLVEEHGGSISPVLAINYGGEKIEYLCFTNEYYQTCVMQQPLLKQHIERELTDYIKADVLVCINTMEENMRKSGYKVESGEKSIRVEVLPKKVKVIVEGSIVVEKEETGERYEKFEPEFRSSLYDFTMLSLSILNWEATYGDSDILSFMLFYPDMKVEKYKQEDGSKIYILTDRNTKEKFTFASRSLSWGSGYMWGKRVSL